MKIKDPVYACDLCDSETNIEVSYVFQPADFSGSIHTRRHFGLCMECHRAIPAKEDLLKKRKWAMRSEKLVPPRPVSETEKKDG